MELAIMIEGQDGLTWPRWQRIATAVEDLGFVGLYRSDHYTNPNPPDKDSLELWVSLTWLACNTSRIEFGPMVAPLSFREPTMMTRMASAIDDLSGGRLIYGVGAGWQEREHTNYGFDLLDIPARFDRFEEGLEVITRLLKHDEPATFSGTYYQLNEATLLPRPQRPGGPPILIGGNGPKRTLPLVAKYADEWNAVFRTAEQFAELNDRLNALISQEGRQPGDIRRSLMTLCIFGEDTASLSANLAKQGRTVDQLQDSPIIHGVPNQIVDQIGVLADLGVERVLLQWMDQDDMDGLEKLAEKVMSQLQ
ncbi:MAG: LLM class F420-dependent oxidoreductase [Chloroflexota bacterium]